jgi:hypothetical protein
MRPAGRLGERRHIRHADCEHATEHAQRLQQAQSRKLVWQQRNDAVALQTPATAGQPGEQGDWKARNKPTDQEATPMQADCASVHAWCGTARTHRVSRAVTSSKVPGAIDVRALPSSTLSKPVRRWTNDSKGNMQAISLTHSHTHTHTHTHTSAHTHTLTHTHTHTHTHTQAHRLARSGVAANTAGSIRVS